MMQEAVDHQDIRTLEMFVHATADRSVLVSDDGVRDHAAELSLALVEVEPGEGGYARITMPSWLARKRGWA